MLQHCCLSPSLSAAASTSFLFWKFIFPPTELRGFRPFLNELYSLHILLQNKNKLFTIIFPELYSGNRPTKTENFFTVLIGPTLALECRSSRSQKRVGDKTYGYKIQTYQFKMVSCSTSQSVTLSNSTFLFVKQSFRKIPEIPSYYTHSLL